MEKLLLSLNEKVKMKLIQPYIKCSGRKDTTCHYKGRVRYIDEQIAHIEFKYKGELITAAFDLTKEQFIHEELKDIKVQQVKPCCFD